jgi:hypothetical protein
MLQMYARAMVFASFGSLDAEKAVPVSRRRP